jgi:hypothetical protein
MCNDVGEAPNGRSELRDPRVGFVATNRVGSAEMPAAPVFSSGHDPARAQKSEPRRNHEEERSPWR